MPESNKKVPSWFVPRRGRGCEKQISTNIHLSDNGYRLRFMGLDPFTAERRQREKQFKRETPPEELERFQAKAARYDEIYKLIRKCLPEEDRRQARAAMPSDPRPLIAAKWVTVAPGIERSEYGWMAGWRETDPLTGKRVTRKQVFATTVPPGESERPPAYVRRYREQRKREGLESKPARWDVPKRHRRAIFVAPPAPHVPSFAPHAPSFAAQLRRRLKKANLTLGEAEAFFGVPVDSIGASPRRNR